MDFFTIISSLNKIGIVFFVITLIALIYEIRAFKKESSQKNPKIRVPEFNPNAPPVTSPTPATTSQQTSPQQASLPPKKPSLVPIIVTAVILVILGGIVMIGYLTLGNGQKTPVAEQPPPTQFVKSTGIKVYDVNWQPLTPADIKVLAPGTQVFIGIATVSSVPVDRARIRVNQTEWTAADETTQFNAEENVYYITYTLPEGFDKLVIEGQLHSVKDGWPPDFVFE